MALITKLQQETLDQSYRGQPFVQVATKATDTNSLDIGYRGAPFSATSPDGSGVVQEASADLSSTAQFAVTATRIRPADVAVAAQTQLTAQAQRIRDIDLFTESRADLALEITRIRDTDVFIESTSELEITVSKSVDADVFIESSAELEALGTVVRNIDVAIESSAELEAAANIAVDADVFASAEFAQTVTVSRTRTLDSVLEAQCNLVADIAVIRDADVFIEGRADLVAQAQSTRDIDAVLISESSLTVLGLRTTDINLVAFTEGGLTATVSRTAQGQSDLSVESDFGVDVGAIRDADVFVESSAELAADVTRSRDIDVFVEARAELTAQAQRSRDIDLFTESRADIAATVSRTRDTDVVIEGRAELVADVTVVRNITATLNSQAAIDIAANVVVDADVFVEARFDCAVTASRIRNLQVAVNSDVVVEANAQRTAQADSVLESTSTVDAAIAITASADVFAEGRFDINTAAGRVAYVTVGPVLENVRLRDSVFTANGTLSTVSGKIAQAIRTQVSDSSIYNTGTVTVGNDTGWTTHQPFAYEFWFNYDTLDINPRRAAILSNTTGTNFQSLRLWVDQTGYGEFGSGIATNRGMLKLQIAYLVDGTSQTFRVNVGEVNERQWYNVAIQGNGDGTFSLWLNGVDSGTHTEPYARPVGFKTFVHGPQQRPNPDNVFDVELGRVDFDEIRATAGIQRYTPGESYTPKILPFVNDVNTLALFHCNTVPQLDDSAGFPRLDNPTASASLIAAVQAQQVVRVNIASTAAMMANARKQAKANAEIDTSTNLSTAALRTKQLAAEMLSQGFALTAVGRVAGLFVNMSVESSLVVDFTTDTRASADLVADTSLVALAQRQRNTGSNIDSDTSLLADATVLTVASAEVVSTTNLTVDVVKLTGVSADLVVDTELTANPIVGKLAAAQMFVNSEFDVVGNRTANAVSNLQSQTQFFAQPFKQAQGSANFFSQGFILTVGRVLALDPYLTYVIEQESRTIVITGESGEFVIDQESKVYIVTEETREYTVEPNTAVNII